MVVPRPVAVVELAPLRPAALDSLLCFSYDTILLDLGLPKLDGMEP